MANVAVQKGCEERDLSAVRFRQGSRQAPWPMRTGLAIAPALRGGADWDGVHWVRVEGGNGAAGAHLPGLPALSLPGLRQAVQRTLRHAAEPDAVSLRRDRARGALAPALQAEPARPARDVGPARYRIQP